MKDLHASIAVDGFFGDSPFRFTTSMRLQQKREGPFEVGEGTRNITLTLDPRGWFVGNLGQVLDPRDPVNRGRIKANIRCSVRMSSEEPAPNDGGPSFRREFEDDDRDNGAKRTTTTRERTADTRSTAVSPRRAVAAITPGTLTTTTTAATRPVGTLLFSCAATAAPLHPTAVLD